MDFMIPPIIINSKLKITENAIEQSSAKKIPKNAVVLVTRVGIGKLGIAGTTISTNQDFNSFVCSSKILPKFLAYFFMHKMPQIIAKSRGVSVKGITIDE